MANSVFVIDTDKRPQNPVHPAHARWLLNQGKAAIYCRLPFTIILKKSRPETQTTPLEIKIDPGSQQPELHC